MSDRKTTHQCSNFDLRVVAVGADTLRHVLGVAATCHAKISSWRISDGWLELTPFTESGFTPLPHTLTTDTELPAFVEGWLRQQEPSGEDPDIDGSVTKDAFEIKMSCDGHNDAIRVRKVWALFHK